MSDKSNVLKSSKEKAREVEDAEEKVKEKPSAIQSYNSVKELHISTEAVAICDARVKVEMNSYFLDSPITEEESTHIY